MSGYDVQATEKLLAESRHVYLKPDKDVVRIKLPDGGVIGLTAQQAVDAEIEPHGNHGCSKIRFTLIVEVEAQGDADANKDRIKRALLAEIVGLRADLKNTLDDLHSLGAKQGETAA